MLISPRFVLAIAAALKAVDFAVRWSPAVAALWVVAASVCLYRERFGACAVAALSAWALLDGHYQNHVALMFWIALTFVLFTDLEQQRFIVRCQLSIVYGFAALSKLHSEWMGGFLLEKHGVWVPFGLVVLAAVGATLTEAWLAWAIWRPQWRKAVLVIATTLHLFFVAGGGDPSVARTGLLIFAVSFIALLTWAVPTAAPRQGQKGTRPLQGRRRFTPGAMLLRSTTRPVGASAYSGRGSRT